MHLLVVANETVTGRKLIEAVERHRNEDLRVTVISPVNQPQGGYVVYEDTRRAANTLPTHPQYMSGWLRRNPLDRIRESAGSTPVEHVVVDLAAETGERNVLVLANETVVG